MRLLLILICVFPIFANEHVVEVVKYDSTKSYFGIGFLNDYEVDLKVDSLKDTLAAIEEEYEQKNVESTKPPVKKSNYFVRLWNALLGR